MLKVFNENWQALYSGLFSILVNYGLQLNCILLGKDIALIFRPFKVVAYSFAQFIKRDTKGVVLKVSVVVVKGQAAQHGRVGLAELLFGNICQIIGTGKLPQIAADCGTGGKQWKAAVELGGLT